MVNPLDSKPKLTAEEWLDQNLIQPYIDYNNKAPDKWLSLLLSGNLEAFQDNAWEDILHWDMETDDDHRQEFIKLYGEDEEYLPQVDTDSAIRDLLRNARNQHVTIYPMLNDETYIEAPACFDYSEELNQEYRRGLMEHLGYTEKQAQEVQDECIYGGTCFAVCGTVDWVELYDKLVSGHKMTGIKVKPSDNIVFHTRWNGAGSAVDFPIAAEKIFQHFDANVDDELRYGVQAVFGFVSEFWRNQLDLVYEAKPASDTLF